MNNQTSFETTNRARAFASRIKPIRSKSLRDFLKLYYLTFILQKDISTKYKWPRKPKIRPGLRFIQINAPCRKSKAQDCLRAIQLTRDVFLEHELETRRLLTRIDTDSYKRLLKEISPIFEDVARILGIRAKDPRKKAKFQDVRTNLRIVAHTIEQSSGVFTPRDCAKIIRELENWFY